MRSAASQYREEVNKRLTCPNALKRSFLRQLETEALCFCADHEDADVRMLSRQFGAPEEVADDFLAELNKQTVEHCSNKRRRILRFAMAVMLAAVIALTFLWAQKYFLQEKLAAEGFIASITYETKADSGVLEQPSRDTILGSNGVEGIQP